MKERLVRSFVMAVINFVWIGFNAAFLFGLIFGVTSVISGTGVPWETLWKACLGLACLGGMLGFAKTMWPELNR